MPKHMSVCFALDAIFITISWCIWGKRRDPHFCTFYHNYRSNTYIQ